MAQPPHPSPRPEPPKPAPRPEPPKPAAQHEAKGKDQHVPLKDPSEGKSPAIIGRDVARTARPEAEAGPGGYGPTIGVRGLPIEDGERDPDTIAEEQRIRSAEMEAMGIEKWKEAHDERTAEEKAEANPVVAPPPKRLEAEKHTRE